MGTSAYTGWWDVYKINKMKKSEQLKERAKFETIPDRFKDKPPSKEQTYYFIESELQEYASEIAKEAFPNIKKNDTEFCGKCGTVI